MKTLLSKSNSPGILYAGVLLAAIISISARPGKAEESGAQVPGNTPPQWELPPPWQTEPKVNEQEMAVIQQALRMEKTDRMKAIEILEAEMKPWSSPGLLFALSGHLLRAEKNAQAADCLQETVKKMPRFHRARMNLCRLLMNEGRFGDASEHLRHLLELSHTEKGTIWDMLTSCLVAREQFIAAESACRQAFVWKPDSHKLRITLAKVLLEQGRNEEAEPLIRKELERDPMREQLWAILANTELDRGDTRSALVLLECACRLGIAESSMLASAGDLYLEQGYPGRALAAYRKAAALEDAPVSRIITGIRALLMMNRAEEAGDLAESLKLSHAEISSDQALDLALLEARILVKTGNIETARRAYEDILKKDPLDGEALIDLAGLLREKDLLDESSVLYERASYVKGYKKKSLVARAQIAVEKEKYKLAVKLIDEALEIKPEPYLEKFRDQVRKAANLHRETNSPTR